MAQNAVSNGGMFSGIPVYLRWNVPCCLAPSLPIYSPSRLRVYSEKISASFATHAGSLDISKGGCSYSIR